MSKLSNCVLPLLAALLLLSGCAVSTRDTVVGGPAVSTGKAEATRAERGNLPRTIAILPFENNTEAEFAHPVVRRTMFNHFSSRNYRMLHWQDVDNRLSLAGLESATEVAQTPVPELAEILGVDGLIFGDITHYDKTFAGVYAQVAVGVELEFVDDQGEPIWTAKDVKRSHAGGVSTTPVGLIMNALVAAKHIHGDLNLYRTADELGRELASRMPEPPLLSQRSKPAITDVVHSGVGQYLRYGDTLEVGLEGDPDMTAVAVIDGIGIIDLDEVQPGQYVGSLTLDKTHNVEDIAVTGRLQDEYGQTSSWVSPYGLLNVDNIPPGKVTGLGAESRAGAVKLRWNPPAADDIAGYTVALADTETGAPDESFESPNSEYIVEGLADFQPAYLAVAATDRAGNTGEFARITGIPAPDPRYGQASPLDSTIPAAISGTRRLSPDGNPYYLRMNSRIATDGTVLVAPGVEIIVSPNARLVVLGELHVFGNGKDPVRVTGVDGEPFNEFLILQTNADVRINGLTAKGGGIPIQITAGSPVISDCTLADSQFNALVISGSARPTIRNCTISNARTSGVIVSGQALPVFEGNRFVDNEPFHIQNGSTYRIDATNNEWKPAASASTILGDVAF